MTVKFTLTFLGKLILGASAFVVGMLFGGMIAGVAALPAPTLPVEMDGEATMIALFIVSPLLVLALYWMGRELVGGWLARSLMLAWLVWIAHVLNNVIEAVVFSSFVTSPWFSLVTFTPAVLLCAGVTVWLWPPQRRDITFHDAWQTFFRQRTRIEWVWRLLLAALIFMPIYYLFGLMVAPFVNEYYRQGEFGLALPTLSTLLPVLFVRSVLFLMACLPVLVAWRGSNRSLWLSLGFALFVCVGLLNLLAAHWIPTWVRAIHLLEILADSLVYAGALVWLLPRGEKSQQSTFVHPVDSAMRPI